MADEKNIQQYTAADIKNYWTGKLSKQAMHALEKAALEDPFLSDALEGYQYANTKDDDTAILHQRLAERTNATAPVLNIKRNNFKWLRIAAAIIVVAGIGLLIQQSLLTKSNSPAIAEDKASNKHEEKAPVGSVNGDTNTSSNNSSLNNSIPGNLTTDTFRNINAGGKKANTKTETFAFTTDTSKKRYEKDYDGVADAVADVKNQKVNEGEFKTAPVAATPEKKEEARQDALAGRSEIDSLKDQFAKARTLNENKENRSANALAKPKVAEGVMQDKADYYQTSFANKFNYRVVDAQNKPVPFANVMNTRDNVGTYTDIRGNFNLVSTDSTMNVQIRSLGYNSAYYKLVPSTQSGFDLILKEDDEARKQITAQNRKVVSSVTRKDSTELEEPEVGWNNYNTYVANNIQIPENLRAKSGKSDVELSFDIDKNGNPVNIKVSRSSQCKACDEEAIRLLKDGPKWKRNGKKNKTTISIAVDQR